MSVIEVRARPDARSRTTNSAAAALNIKSTEGTPSLGRPKYPGDLR
jgi:hypothetical protein